jgi:hypothetical protein
MLFFSFMNLATGYIGKKNIGLAVANAKVPLLNDKVKI